ncbi:hypothetical protein TNCV_4038741 [Trichonephila clavipes]|nr:hypothetical protein TNCV_4038741 [Trichonephila clavipes]
MCMSPIRADKDALEFVQSITDADSDDENEINSFCIHVIIRNEEHREKTLILMKTLFTAFKPEDDKLRKFFECSTVPPEPI